MNLMRNGDVSFWWHQLGLPVARAPLSGKHTADVAIVGGGLTGLWTAYYLKQASPESRVMVVEQRFCGFGASGRNGGWLSADVAGSRPKYLEVATARGQDGAAATKALTQAMIDGLYEVASVVAANAIDCDLTMSGVLRVARNAAQQHRLDGLPEAESSWGQPDWTLLSAAEATERIHISGATGAAFLPHCARVHPAKLSLGVAKLAESVGVEIYEQSPVTDIAPGVIRTYNAEVAAGSVLTCVEGFTAQLRGHRRDVLPMNSAMIATARLSDAQWDRIGWSGNELFGDMAHAYMYAQRTADGRIALGGRGVPYRYGSAVDHDGVTQRATIRSLVATLHELFPSTAEVDIVHAWCGVLGVSRDWSASVTYDPVTGLGSAGGYVGSGLTTTNVAGRTLRDLVLGRDTELTALPWVNNQLPKWEPEPLRYTGVAAMYAAYRAADKQEFRAGTPTTSPVAAAADVISGRRGKSH